MIFQKNFFKINLVALTVLWTVSGCYEQRSISVYAYLRPYKTDSIEIEIPYALEGRGNIHNFDLKKYNYTSAHWIYLSKKAPTASADSLVLCYERYKTTYPWPQSNLRGNIEMNDSLLTVSLTIPYYNQKDIITKWKQYDFNGSYRLKVIR